MYRFYTIIVNGKPRPQARHRHTKAGFTYDPSSKYKKDFITQVRSQAPNPPLNGRISLKAIFSMPYVKKHYRTGKYSGMLKANSPYEYTIKPDIDNLLKFVLDAGNKVLWYDDSQIWKVETEKVYSEIPSILLEIMEEPRI
tara:strand:+ start:4962 stop:5384 length:423 start_codon:yes stop_codon:yes gene_type:complete